MKIILHKGYGGGFHPGDFERELTDEYELEYPYKVSDLYYEDSNHTVRENNIRSKELSYEDWLKDWRSNGDLIDIVSKHIGYYAGYTHKPVEDGYVILELPDNTDYKVAESEGNETAYFYLNNKMWDDREYAEYLYTLAHTDKGAEAEVKPTIAPFQYENKYLEEPDR